MIIELTSKKEVFCGGNPFFKRVVPLYPLPKIFIADADASLCKAIVLLPFYRRHPPLAFFFHPLPA
jgi:hypothetical protein